MPKLTVTAVLFLSLTASAHSSIKVRYGQPATPAHNVIREREVTGQFLEHAASLITTAVRLPRTIWLEFRECDELAFWDPTIRTVTICYGYYDFVKSVIETSKLRSVIVFTILHELGHALISELDLPVLGRGEDAADHFATTVALSAESTTASAIVVDAAWFFLALRKRQEPTFWDECCWGSRSADSWDRRSWDESAGPRAITSSTWPSLILLRLGDERTCPLW